MALRKPDQPTARQSEPAQVADPISEHDEALLRRAAWSRLTGTSRKDGQNRLALTMVSFIILRPSSPNWGDEPAAQVRTGEVFFRPISYGCSWTTFDMSWDRYLFANAKQFRVAKRAGYSAEYQETDVVVMQPLGELPTVALISCGPPLGLDGVSFEHLIIDWEFQFRPADTKRAVRN